MIGWICIIPTTVFIVIFVILMLRTERDEAHRTTRHLEEKNKECEEQVLDLLNSDHWK